MPAIAGAFSRSGRRRRGLAWVGALLLLAALCGCGETSTSPLLPPVESELLGVDGRQVLWTTSVATRSAVRYGFVSGEYDRIAYPEASGGEDRVYVRDHSVPLLSAVAGAPIYIRRTDMTDKGRFYVAAEETVVFAALPAAAPLLKFATLDVQFGDSHVLMLPSEGKIVMIDAGNPYVQKSGQKAPAHVNQWLEDVAVTRIDCAFATHTHADHYGGFEQGANDANDGILDLYEIGMWLDVPAVSGNQSAHDRVIAKVAAKGIQRYVIAPGMTDATDPDALGWDPLVDVTVLNAGSQPQYGGNINDDSICLKITYDDVDILTGGDCEAQAEAWMLTHFPQVLHDMEYFKAFHHGRNDENTRNFLEVIAPRVTVIPIAVSAYDEGPAGGLAATQDTINRLKGIGSDVFRFDDAAPIGYPNDNQTFWHTTFVTDGASYEIRIEPSIWGLPVGSGVAGGPAGQPVTGDES
jgi:competence protein ComEC